MSTVDVNSGIAHISVLPQYLPFAYIRQLFPIDNGCCSVTSPPHILLYDFTPAHTPASHQSFAFCMHPLLFIYLLDDPIALGHRFRRSQR